VRQSRARPSLGRLSRSRTILVVGVVALTTLLSSCSWVSDLFGGNKVDTGEPVSVFDVEVGDCFVAPTEVKAELSNLGRVPCAVPHQLELYALEKYQGQNGSDDYPGNDVLETFAKGVCAQAFTGYVGIAYPDSSLWLTDLLPSARSWQQSNDRSVLCFVTTTGDPLTASVKGSKR
jgi:hypothetical protein